MKKLTKHFSSKACLQTALSFKFEMDIFHLFFSSSPAVSLFNSIFFERTTLLRRVTDRFIFNEIVAHFHPGV